MAKKNLKNFNEAFVDAYENPSLLTKFDVEDKAHIEIDPLYGDAILQAKKVRDKMKDDFKEQDKLVKDFLSTQDLEENPKLPDVNTKSALKAMKLAENYLTEDDLKEEREIIPLNFEEAGMEVVPAPAEFSDLSGDDSLEESVSLKEDYSNFIGRPLKDFLKTLDGKEKINIDYKTTTRDGLSGVSGRVNQVPWDVADRLIKDIQLGDENYYKFKILTEDKKKDLNEDVFDDEEQKPKRHRYKVVAADENASELFVKDVAGLNKVNNVLAELTDDKLNGMGATQVYVVRDDDKEVYFKYGNIDGTWEVDQDDREYEKEVEERDTLFNHIVADLSAESKYFVGHLRNLPRKRGQYVGFDSDEIGFKDDVFHLKSLSDKPIEWAKKVAAYYGLTTSDVKLGENGYHYIDIYAPGVSSDPLLVP